MFSWLFSGRREQRGNDAEYYMAKLRNRREEVDQLGQSLKPAVRQNHFGDWMAREILRKRNKHASDS